MAMVERGEAAELPLKTQAELLSLNQSGLYYQPAPSSEDEITIKHKIDRVYTKCLFYGSRKIAAQLRREGVIIKRKAVQRHMREMGIAGIVPRSN